MPRQIDWLCILCQRCCILRGLQEVTPAPTLDDLHAEDAQEEGQAELKAAKKVQDCLVGG